MEPEFWHERWTQRQIGFHQDQVNPRLINLWPKIEPLMAGGDVFVPLCGKSLDMTWLHERGFPVIGVELSPLAAGEYFEERRIQPTRKTEGPFEVFEGQGVRILCGDFFDLRREHLASVSAVFDRAALIALPQEMQTAYVRHLFEVLPTKPPILLVTLDYDPSEMSGPPFATSTDRVNALFEHAYHVELGETLEVLDESPGLRERGLSWLTESGYLLSNR